MPRPTGARRVPAVVLAAALVAALTALLAAPHAASAANCNKQWSNCPAGSYQRSCGYKSCAISNNAVLSCSCGGPFTTLTNAWACSGCIGVDSSKMLACSLPHGSYVESGCSRPWLDMQGALNCYAASNGATVSLPGACACSWVTYSNGQLFCAATDTA